MDNDEKNTELENSYQAFLNSCMSTDPLSAEENLRLLKEYRQKPDDFELRNEIDMGNIGLVITEATKYARMCDRRIDIMDLIHEGNRGLMKAIEDFDIQKGFAFSTLADSYIKNAIRTYLSKYSRIILLPNSVLSKKRQVDKVEAMLNSKLGRKPTPEEISRELDDGTSPDDIRDLYVLTRTTTSIEASSKEDDEGHVVSLFDYLSDGTDASTEVALKEKRRLLQEGLATLTEREKDILLSHSGEKTGVKESLKSISLRYGKKISEERVRQIYEVAKKKVKDYILDKLG